MISLSAGARSGHGVCTDPAGSAASNADVEFFAPAKVNLSLRVLRRRDDGFHEIESLVCPLSLYDTLDLAHREEGGLDFACDDPTIPAGDDNLVVRAAQLFCESCGFEP